MKERALELILTATVAAGGAIAAIGASSPAKRLDDHENRLRVVEEHQGKMDTQQAVMQNDLLYIKDAVDELRGHRGRASR